ncbi:hypothetical protein ACQ4PT_006663 [Festuca glaucescens]
MAARALLVIAVTLAVFGIALGASYTVGTPRGYSRAAHNVVEVSKADYDACSASSPIASFQTGNDIVPLAAAGSRYFICGVPGHCDAGMKVWVLHGSTGAPSPVSPRAAAPAVAPMPSGTTPSTSGQEMPPSSSAVSAGAGSVGLCLGVIFTAGLMLFY